MTDVRDVIVIGSGPSGYTAALYAARARLHPLLFEGSVTSGGALMKTTDVENYPGFPDGVLGPDLMDSMRKQAERFGAELITDDVTEVDLTVDPKVVKVGGDTYLAKTVIIATGSAYRQLNVPGEDLLAGHGVSWCATCDGFFFREQDIAVVGPADDHRAAETAFDQRDAPQDESPHDALAQIRFLHHEIAQARRGNHDRFDRRLGDAGRQCGTPGERRELGHE